MTTYHYLPMNEQYASAICKWMYPAPYNLYDMGDSSESINDLLNGDYFYALDSQDMLVGYICSGNSARVPGGYQIGIYDNNKYLDFGVGLRPDYTGKGNGLEFLSQGIEYLMKESNVHNIQLVVAAFNDRAIKVYERVGFVQGCSFKSKVDDEEIDFIVMWCSLNKTI